MQKFERKLWIPICLLILTLTMILPLLIHEVKAEGGQIIYDTDPGAIYNGTDPDGVIYNYTDPGACVDNDTDPDVAIYNGTGAWVDSVVPFKNFTKYKGLTWKYVTASDINTGKVTYPTYKVLYMPGGWAGDYNTAITSAGMTNIRNFVSSGGGYIGICAGAFFACDICVWEGRTYDYPLNLFSGRGIGSIPEIMPWDYAAMTNLTMNLAHPINQYEPSRERMAYYGGGYFVPNAGVTVDTVATYDKKANERAAITFTYGSGRVFLIGTHPEIEEDSARDGSSWAEIWYDYGSDWPLLWTTMDWLMGWTISQPPAEPYLPPAGTQLFFEGFESGSLSTNGWTTSGTGKPWYVSTESPYEGTYHAMAKATGAGKWSYLTSRTISTAGYTGMVSLRYFRRIRGHDAADGFTVEWYDGTKWNLIEEKNKWDAGAYCDVWVFAGQGLVWELPSGALNNPNFKIRFGDMCGAVSEMVYLDYVEIRAYGTSDVTFAQDGVGTDFTGTVLMVDGIGYARAVLPKTFTWEIGSIHTFAYHSPLVVGGKQYVWTSTSGLSTAQSGTITVPIGSGSVTGYYKTQYYLTVTSPYGTPGGTGWYDKGSTAYATVTPLTVPGPTGVQYVFTHWSGDASGTASPSGPITMDGPKTAVANWKTQYYLTVVSPYGTPSGEGWYDEGTDAYAGLDTDIVTYAGTRHLFVKWAGDAMGTNYAQSNPIHMNAPKTAIAEWKTQYYLTVVSSHDTPGGEGWYDEGDTAYAILLTGLDYADGVAYGFTSWSGDASGWNLLSNPIIMDRPKTAIANWEASPAYGDVRTIGFWKHQVNVWYFIELQRTGVKIKGIGTAQIPQEELISYLVFIDSNSEYFKGKIVSYNGDGTINKLKTLENAYNILQTPTGPSSMKMRAEQQLLAVWLNLARKVFFWNTGLDQSLEFIYQQYGLESIGEAIEYSEHELLSNRNFEAVKNICDSINNNFGILWGT